jgi:formylglycine-generating enzyme required for sulfatase activity
MRLLPLLAVLPTLLVLTGGVSGCKRIGKLSARNSQIPETFVKVEVDSSIFVYRGKGPNCFYIDRYELTQKEYQRLTNENPSKNKGDDLPVENINYWDAILYCNLRSIEEKLEPCYSHRTLGANPAEWPNNWREGTTLGEWYKDHIADGYRLPTELEYLYAALDGKISAGDKKAFFARDDWDRLAWYQGNSGGKSHPAGGKTPNQYKLYDIFGNVSEMTNELVEGGRENEAGEYEDLNFVIAVGCNFNSSLKAMQMLEDGMQTLSWMNARREDIGMRLVRQPSRLPGSPEQP